MLNIPAGMCIQGIHFNSSEKNQSQPTLFYVSLQIIWRPGFGLYSHHQAVLKHELRNYFT
jgi:hypothetical protein